MHNKKKKEIQLEMFTNDILFAKFRTAALEKMQEVTSYPEQPTLLQ